MALIVPAWALLLDSRRGGIIPLDTLLIISLTLCMPFILCDAQLLSELLFQSVIS